MSRKIAVFLLLLVFCAAAGAGEREYYVRMSLSLKVQATTVETLESWIRATHKDATRTTSGLVLQSVGTSKREYPNDRKALGCCVLSTKKVPISQILSLYSALLDIQDQPGVAEVCHVVLRLSATEPIH